jgi:integrase
MEGELSCRESASVGIPSVISFGTLLKANGEDIKTAQKLLRHTNSRITLDVYTQAVTSNKRAAQSRVVKMTVSDMGQKVEEKYPQTQQ